MDSITGESFSFRSKFQQPKKITRKRLPTNANKAKLEVSPTIPIEEEKVPITDTLDILQAYRVFVDRKLNDYKYYEQLAQSLGATVLQDPKDGISVLVHGPRDKKGRPSKLVSNAIENHIQVVSPAWLRQCYTSRTILSLHLYPCDFTERKKLRKESIQDDNPFGVDLNALGPTATPTASPATRDLSEQSGEESPQAASETIVERETTITTVSETATTSDTSSSTQQRPTPIPAIDNATVRELLSRKRKEQAEKEKHRQGAGSSKKPKKGKTLTSFFSEVNKMSLSYGESSRKQ